MERETRAVAFAEEGLGRLSLIAYVLAVCLDGPGWIVVVTGVLFGIDCFSIGKAWWKEPIHD